MVKRGPLNNVRCFALDTGTVTTDTVQDSTVLFGYAGTGFDSCTITIQRGFVFVVCVLMIAVI